MHNQRDPKRLLIGTSLVWMLVLFVAAPRLTAEHRQNLLGGPRGIVRSTTGMPFEGVMVQLVSEKNSIRTTVYSNEDGRYEFPILEPGFYTLRVAKPLEFKSYQRSSIKIEGAVHLDDIVLSRVTESEFLPPSSEILPQLTDAEWLWNLPGTAQEKKIFSYTCSNCHNLQWAFRVRYDERSWRLIVDRMLHYRTRLLRERLPFPPGKGDGPLQSEENFEMIVKWLAKVRGPEAKDPPLEVFQGPRGPATRVIVTEYELPTVDERPQDVIGDSKGYIWYSANRRPAIGRLDPRTGFIKQYRTPREPGKAAGTQRLIVNNKGIIWYTDAWAENLYRFNPQKEEFRKLPGGWAGSLIMGADGFLWEARGGEVLKIDPETGLSVKRYPIKTAHTVPAVGSEVSADGRFFAGGVPFQRGFDGVVLLDITSGEVAGLSTPSGAAHPSAGAFDQQDNAWFGGKGGVLLKLDTKTRRLSEYVPPTPFVSMSDATPDKNGDIWTPLMGGGRIGRFNPRTQQWIEYVLPEPYSMGRTWVDNTTDPVTVWFGDYNGYIVRLQPLE